jgi:hypothetical protein
VVLAKRRNRWLGDEPGEAPYAQAAAVWPLARQDALHPRRKQRQLAQPELETDVALFENGKLSGDPACG